MSKEHYTLLIEKAPDLERFMDIEGALLSTLDAKDVITEDHRTAIKSEVGELIRYAVEFIAVVKMTRKTCLK